MKDFSAATERLQQELDTRRDTAGPAGSRALIRSVQSQIDAVARGDFDAVLKEALPDVALDIFAPPEFSWIRRAQGASELRRAMEHNFSTLEDQQPRVTDVFAEGETVVLFGREQGRIRATGQRYDVEFVEKFTFSEGRLAAVRIIAAHALSGPRFT